MLKDTWIDLEDAVVGMPDSGDEVSSEPINQIANAVIELEENMPKKADKSKTLAGYGITDAYTKEQVDAIHDEMVEYVDSEVNTVRVGIERVDTKLNDNYYNKETVDEIHDEIAEYCDTEINTVRVGIERVDTKLNDLDKKIDEKEIILYEDVVNTPEWTNQPTYEGTLAEDFNTEDFYYVTLKDADGNDLPDGQFMLKDFYTDDATVYSTVFSLKSLDTGFDTLIENYLVEFTSLTPAVKMRDAGVWEVSYTPKNWKLNGEKGSIKITVFGEFVQRFRNTYFISSFRTDKNVSSYHSDNSTFFQYDNTKQIIPYSPLEDMSYKTNKFYDECEIERCGDNRYSTKRMTSLRYIKQGTSSYSVSSHNVFGYGEIKDADTFITRVNIQVGGNFKNGVIRNGSVIRVSEVK